MKYTIAKEDMLGKYIGLNDEQFVLTILQTKGAPIKGYFRKRVDEKYIIVRESVNSLTGDITYEFEKVKNG